MLTAGPKASSKRFDRDQILGKPIHYLLDVTYAGRVMHLSRDTFEVKVNATGEVLQYEGVIENEIEWEEAFDLFADSGDVLSLAITAVLPCDVPTLVSQGFDLLQATAELSSWAEGTAYEDRRVLLRGRFTDPSYGWKEDPISVSIQSEFFEDRGLIPPAQQVVSETSWPLTAEGAIGLSYPVVFGVQPGNDAAGDTSMSPAYLVVTSALGPGDETLLVCGHQINATTVRVSSNTDTQDMGVSTMKDGLGRTVTIIGGTGIGLAPLAFADDDDFFVNLKDGGGLPVNTRDAPISGAGDLIEYLLTQTTLTLDTGRISAAKPYLNRFKITGCITEGVTPFDYITSNLSPILPMSIVNGPWGLYMIPWRYDATLKDVVERIDADVDPSVELNGPVQYEGAIKDIVNEFKLRYALRARTGIMRGVASMGANRLKYEDGSVYATAYDPGSAESVYCRASQLRYGKREDEQETTVVYDDATAGLIVSWWARAKAFPTRVITYRVGNDKAWLERGDVVSITDSRLALSEQIAIVGGMTFIEDGGIELVLRVVENAAQKFKSKGV